MKIRLPEKKIIAPWKTRIISLMQTVRTDGLTVEDVLKIYPTAPRKYVEKAIEELQQDGIAEEVK